jgi:hypothetical protein
MSLRMGTRRAIMRLVHRVLLVPLVGHGAGYRVCRLSFQGGKESELRIRAASRQNLLVFLEIASAIHH